MWDPHVSDRLFFPRERARTGPKMGCAGWKRADRAGVGPTVVFFLFFFFFFLFYLKFQISKPNSNFCFEFQMLNFKYNPNVNVNSTIFPIIIYSLPIT
jgi:hypothetical protein